MKTVIVASQNPVKIHATELGFSRVFPNLACTFSGIQVASGVSEQPMSDAETLLGAKTRVQNAKSNNPDADYWVGIEGGIDDTADGLQVFAWVVIDSRHQRGQSRTSTFHLPPSITTLIRDGIELGIANDMIFHQHESKKKGGAVGSLTNDLIGRTEYYIQPVILALVPFLKPELYPNCDKKD